MAYIQIIGGDFDNGKYEFTENSSSKELFLRKPFTFDLIELKKLERVELHSEESVKKMAGTIGWGFAGALVLGPIGAIGGLLVGGRGKQVCFAGYFKNGKKFLATTDNKTYQKIAALIF